MIKKLTIQNFKSFSDIQEIELSPITLIYGPNSSGKSTIIQSLLLQKQSVLAGDKSGELISTGDGVTLGEFSSFVNNHDISKNIKFGIDYSLTQDARAYRELNDTNLLFGNADNRHIELSYSFDKKHTLLDWMLFECENKMPLFSISRLVSNGFKFKESKGFKDYVINKSNADPKVASIDKKIKSTFEGGMGTTGSINLPLNCLNNQFSGANTYLQKVSDDILALFESFRYLGPLRSSPKRFYARGFDKDDNGKGRNNLGLDLMDKGIEVVENINKRLIDFEIPYKLRVENIGNNITGDLVSIELEDLRSGAKITPVDVGFGIGQVLPIILEAEVGVNNVICVEQPEIHLHPKLQAHMADLFIDSVDKKNGNNQWIIETHSEALMLRLQRRIRTGVISKDLVSVLYVDVGEEGARVTRLPLDDDGDFMVHWPNGFFEERFQEMTGN
jgi:predicted ATPase